MLEQTLYDKSGFKNCRSVQTLSLLRRTIRNRDYLLQQLQQVNIDTSKLQHLPLNQLYNKMQSKLRSTYSIKYLGLSNNQIGIVSKRIDSLIPIKGTIQDISNSYTINKYIYPKPLKIGQKCQSKSTISKQNLEEQIKNKFSNYNKNIKQPSRIHQLKQVKGSWINSTNKRNSKHKSLAILQKNIGHDLSIPCVQTSSYSRFLNQGVMIVKN